MKNILQLPRAFRAILVAAFALFGTGALEAANFFDNSVGGIDLGNASGGSSTINSTHKNWAIFALSGGVTITDPSYINGAYDAVGNIGMAGTGVLTLSNASINGSVYNVSGNGPVLSGTTSISNSGTAGPTVDATYLNNAATSAGLASTNAAAMTATIGTTTIAFNDGANHTVNATGAITVLNLQDLILSGINTVLTLNATAPNQNFVINVSRYMTLSANAQIQLTGGLGANNVLFNVKNTNTYDVTLSGASVVNGIILAPSRNVKLTGASVVNGEVIGKGVSLSGRSKVINPFVSP